MNNKKYLSPVMRVIVLDSVCLLANSGDNTTPDAPKVYTPGDSPIWSNPDDYNL